MQYSYSSITTLSPKALAEKVYMAIQKGWEPIGTNHVIDADGVLFYFQPVRKRDDEEIKDAPEEKP